MELQDFLKQYLPDYLKKAREENFNVMMNNIYSYHERMKFNEKHFPEAFDNFKKEFVDKICAKQRRNCLNAWQYSHSNDGNVILNAEQPKLEDII